MNCIYAIGDGTGAIKFGISRNPVARLNELQTGNPRKLELISSADMSALNPAPGHRYAAQGAEEVIHQWLTEVGLRMSGEWFGPSIITTIIAELIQHDPEAACGSAVVAGVDARQRKEKA